MFDISEATMAQGGVVRWPFAPFCQRPCPRNAFSRQFVSPEAFTSLYASLSMVAFLHVTTHKRDILSSNVANARRENKIGNLKIVHCRRCFFKFFFFFFFQRTGRDFDAFPLVSGKASEKVCCYRL